MKIEVESLAYDLERDAAPPAEPEEGRDPGVHRGVPPYVLDELLPARMDERELAGHHLPRPEDAGAVEPFDLLPLLRGEAGEEVLRDVRGRDRPVEIAEDGEPFSHRGAPGGCPPPPSACVRRSPRPDPGRPSGGGGARASRP